MKDKLSELFNQLEHHGKKREASAVQYLLGSFAEDGMFDEFASDIVIDEESAGGNVTVPSLDIQINVFTNPLGAFVREYMEKLARIFNRDESQRNESVSVKEIDFIADRFKHFNNDLTFSKEHWSNNGSLIQPNTVKDLVVSIASFVYHNSPFEIDPDGYMDMVEHLYETYGDFYIEEYLNAAKYDPAEYSQRVDEFAKQHPDYIHETSRELLEQYDRGYTGDKKISDDTTQIYDPDERDDETTPF